MQQRYAALLLVAAVLFAGVTVFSLCLLQPKRQHTTPSTKKYGLDAYDALAGLPIRKRSGGSVIPILSASRSPLYDNDKTTTTLAKQVTACQAYPDAVCKESVIYSQCMLTNSQRHAAPAFCLHEAMGRDTLTHGAPIVSFVQKVLSKAIADSDDNDGDRMLQASGFLGQTRERLRVDVQEARQRAEHADLAEGFLIDDEPRRP